MGANAKLALVIAWLVVAPFAARALGIDDEAIALFDRTSQLSPDRAVTSGASDEAPAPNAVAAFAGLATQPRLSAPGANWQPRHVASIWGARLGGGPLPDASRSSRETIDATSQDAPPPGCTFFKSGAERVPASDCMSCHGLHRTHPVEIDYTMAAAARPGFYRSLAEATRRGVFLPDGQVKCVTCHDPASPWKYKIALPPGAKASPAVETMTPQQLAAPRTLAAVAPRPGTAVTPTPLCTACHAYGD